MPARELTLFRIDEDSTEVENSESISDNDAAWVVSGDEDGASVELVEPPVSFFVFNALITCANLYLYFADPFAPINRARAGGRGRRRGRRRGGMVALGNG